MKLLDNLILLPCTSQKLTIPDVGIFGTNKCIISESVVFYTHDRGNRQKIHV